MIENVPKEYLDDILDALDITNIQKITGEKRLL